MSIRGKAFIAGVYEHPGRHLPDQSLMEIHARVCVGALADAGLTMKDVDAYFGAGDSPGFGVLSMIAIVATSAIAGYVLAKFPFRSMNFIFFLSDEKLPSTC